LIYAWPACHPEWSAKRGVEGFRAAPAGIPLLVPGGIQRTRPARSGKQNALTCGMSMAGNTEAEEGSFRAGTKRDRPVTGDVPESLKQVHENCVCARCFQWLTRFGKLVFHIVPGREILSHAFHELDKENTSHRRNSRAGRRKACNIRAQRAALLPQNDKRRARRPSLVARLSGSPT
jgi:hypothetical protein